MSVNQIATEEFNSILSKSKLGASTTHGYQHFLKILSLFCFSLIFSLAHLAVPRNKFKFVSFYPSQFTVAHMHKLLQK